MWPNSQEPAALVTFTEEILIRKLHFLCSVKSGMVKCTLDKSKCKLDNTAIPDFNFRKVHKGEFL